LPFEVSPTFANSANAPVEVRIKVKAATAANVRDIAAPFLLALVEDANASQRQTPVPQNYSAKIYS
jgi:hypothetical protein